MSYLDIDSLSVHYGKTKALSDLSLSIERGELFTLLGPSGSGKSTILNSVAGFVDPTEGQITLDQKNVTHLPPNKREIGMVFQSYALFPHKSVAENIAYPLKLRKLPKNTIREKVTEYLKMVDLAEFADRKPGQLSGGQQQRVALARALVFEPRLLLLDEPLGALDKKLRERMQFEIRRIQRSSNTTVLCVTHDQQEAMTLSDRMAVMNVGCIEQVGTPREIYDEPKNVFVADFVGGANFLEVNVSSVKNDSADILFSDQQFDSVPISPFTDSANLSKKLTWMIRPEHLTLASHEDNLPGLKATVLESFFLGETHNVRVELQKGTELTIREPASETLESKHGDTVLVSINTKDTRLFNEPLPEE